MTSHRTATLSVTSNDVGMLVSRLFDETRTRPIVVLSPASDTGKPRVPEGMLSHRFTGLIAVLENMAASTALSDEIGDGLRVFGGAVRVFFPGATRGCDNHDHPLFMTFPDESPHRTADAVVDRILGLTESRPAGSHQMAVEAPARPLPAPMPVPHRSATPAPRPGPVPVQETPAHEGSPDTSPPVPETLSDLPEQVAATTTAAVTDLIAGLVADRDSELAREVARERARAGAAEEALAALNADHHVLTDRLATLRAQWDDQRKTLEERIRVAEKAAGAPKATPWPPTVHPDDPEAQFRYEVEQRWLMTYAVEDRRSHPLRDYTLAPGFLASLDTEIVPTRKAVDVCVEVVSQRVWESKRCHPATEKGGGSKARTRACGATAYRAYIKSACPGAPRLMWWQGVDGTIELVAAAHHDDMSAL